MGEVAYAYNDANELTTSTQAGFETDYSYDDWGRMVTKEQSTNGYLATYRWRYGRKLKVAESNFPGEGDVGYMYDGLGKRRFRQTDVESANIDTWYRWDTKGHVLAEYENDTGAFWDIGDMSMYLVPGSVLAQSKGNSPGTDAMHYHHDDGDGKIAIMTDGDRNVTYQNELCGAPDPEGESGDVGEDPEPDPAPESQPDPKPTPRGRVLICVERSITVHHYIIIDPDGDGEGTRWEFGNDSKASKALLCRVPGDVKNTPKTGPGKGDACKEFVATEQELEKIRKFWEQLDRDTPDYNFEEYNCSNAPWDCLQDLRKTQDPPWIRPNPHPEYDPAYPPWH